MTVCISYHRTLGPTVHEAAGGFFVEAVVSSGGFGYLLHDHLGLDVLLCPGIYCDMSPLQNTQVQKQVDLNDEICGENILDLYSFSDANHI